MLDPLSESGRLMALAALLNLSTVGDNQMRICEHGLELLLEIAVDLDNPLEVCNHKNFDSLQLCYLCVGLVKTRIEKLVC